MFGVGTGVIVMLAVFGQNVFGAGEVGIGLLYAARGLGALIGPFGARAIFKLDNRGIVRGIIASVVIVVIAYGLFPLSSTIWIAALLVFGAHLGAGSQWMLSTYGLQRAAPDEIRGRVFSLDYGLVTITIAFSSVLAGVLSENFAPEIAVWAMVALIGIAGLGWAFFTRSLWLAPREGATGSSEPEVS
jgi:predicted MFS family arabinose efflux permease